MSLWITDNVVTAISTIPDVSILRITQGEDRTTQAIDLGTVNPDLNIFIRGFVTDGYLKSDNNVNIEMVEVSSGYSDGDMPNDPEYVIVHARVKAAIMRLGHSVVNSMDPYF